MALIHYNTCGNATHFTITKEGEMDNNMSTKSERYHGLDLLRGFAMILGLLMHASLAYKVDPGQIPR